MNNNVAISVTNLSVSYNKTIILDNISFNIQKGDKLAIIGKNGAGKTTLIEAIIGLNKVSNDSKIEINDEYKKSIGCVYQDMNYDGELTLKEIYSFYMKIIGKELNYDIFDVFGLSAQLKKRFRSLSGGQKQKFKLLMVLSLEPKLLILDELSTSLDYEWRNEIKELIKNYLEKNKDVVMILVSHDYKEIKNLCSKYYLIEDKKLKELSNLKLFFKDEN